MAIMKMSMVIFTKCNEYSPLSKKADRYGNKTFWRADYGTHSFAWGDTKKKCMAEARAYISRNNERESSKAI